MTTKISDDQAMDAVVATRPDTDTIDHAWYVGRREQVLNQVLSTPRNLPGTARTPSTVPVRPQRQTRWRLVAAAVAVVAAGGLFAQVLVPLGSPGSPQAAQALDRLAGAVPANPVIPDGSYELTVYEDSGIAESDNGPISYATVRSTWTGADGWAWAHQTGDDPAYYIFPPAPRNYDLNAVPADPTVMEAYLRARVMGSSSVEEALFEAVKETLAFTPTPAATRAASIRMLAGVPGVTVTENTTDPNGRPATKVAFVDEQRRPGVVNALYLDPDTTQVVAELRTQNTKPFYTCIYTERRIVTSLPDNIINTLGTDRTYKSIP
ncbi:MAG: hypothetical protein AAGC63_14915 [Propionicimonas sp.]|nr:hypothetical protein [Propionicimonas sp.]